MKSKTFVMVAFLLAAITTARAEVITYAVVDYPNSQVGDLPYTGAQHVRGSTITIDTGATELTGTGIAIPFSDITAATLDLQTTLGDGIYPVNLSPPVSSSLNLMASTSELYLTGSTGYLTLQSGPSGLPLLTGLYYSISSGVGEYSGELSGGIAFFYDSVTASGPSLQNDTIGNSPMLIATVVPEPSAFVLLGIATISLLAYAWRRRK